MLTPSEEENAADCRQRKGRESYLFTVDRGNTSARERHSTQHVGNVIETIVAVMAFDLANAVLLLVEDLHVAIPQPPNESLGRGDPTP